MAYWLMKSEPSVFSIDDLKRSPKKTTCWEGVRNYQARNMLRDKVAVGDQMFFYHSSCDEPGIVGVCDIVKAGYPDFTAWDPQSKYFDPKSPADNPRWFMVDVRFKRKLPRTIALAELRDVPRLEGMVLLRRGNRLSVMPVSESHWKRVLSLV